MTTRVETITREEVTEDEPTVTAGPTTVTTRTVTVTTTTKTKRSNNNNNFKTGRIKITKSLLFPHRY